MEQPINENYFRRLAREEALKVLNEKRGAEDEWLTVPQVAEIAKQSPGVVYDAIRSGALPADRISPRRIRVRRSRVFEWKKGLGA